MPPNDDQSYCVSSAFSFRTADVDFLEDNTSGIPTRIRPKVILSVALTPQQTDTDNHVQVIQLQKENAQLLGDLIEQDLLSFSPHTIKEREDTLRQALLKDRQNALNILQSLDLKTPTSLSQRHTPMPTSYPLTYHDHAQQQQVLIAELQHQHPERNYHEIWQLAKHQQPHLFQPQTPTQT